MRKLGWVLFGLLGLATFLSFTITVKPPPRYYPSIEDRYEYTNVTTPIVTPTPAITSYKVFTLTRLGLHFLSPYLLLHLILFIGFLGKTLLDLRAEKNRINEKRWIYFLIGLLIVGWGIIAYAQHRLVLTEMCLVTSGLACMDYALFGGYIDFSIKFLGQLLLLVSLIMELPTLFTLLLLRRKAIGKQLSDGFINCFLIAILIAILFGMLKINTIPVFFLPGASRLFFEF